MAKAEAAEKELAAAERKIEDLKASGANEFLQKPFEAEVLVDRICGLLDMESVAAGS